MRKFLLDNNVSGLWSIKFSMKSSILNDISPKCLLGYVFTPGTYFITYLISFILMNLLTSTQIVFLTLRVQKTYSSLLVDKTIKRRNPHLLKELSKTDDTDDKEKGGEEEGRTSSDLEND